MCPSLSHWGLGSEVPALEVLSLSLVILRAPLPLAVLCLGWQTVGASNGAGGVFSLFPHPNSLAR